jgi:hypothetical protein
MFICITLHITINLDETFNMEHHMQTTSAKCVCLYFLVNYFYCLQF